MNWAFRPLAKYLFFCPSFLFMFLFLLLFSLAISSFVPLFFFLPAFCFCFLLACQDGLAFTTSLPCHVTQEIVSPTNQLFAACCLLPVVPMSTSTSCLEVAYLHFANTMLRF